jgi:hypothetical protein
MALLAIWAAWWCIDGVVDVGVASDLDLDLGRRDGRQRPGIDEPQAVRRDSMPEPDTVTAAANGASVAGGIIDGQSQRVWTWLGRRLPTNLSCIDQRPHRAGRGH